MSSYKPCPGLKGQPFCGQERKPGQAYCAECGRAYQRERNATLRREAGRSYVPREHVRVNANKCDSCGTTPPKPCLALRKLDDSPIALCESCANGLTIINEFIGVMRTHLLLQDYEQAMHLLRQIQNPGSTFKTTGENEGLTNLRNAVKVATPHFVPAPNYSVPPADFGPPTKDDDYASRRNGPPQPHHWSIEGWNTLEWISDTIQLARKGDEDAIFEIDYWYTELTTPFCSNYEDPPVVMPQVMLIPHCRDYILSKWPDTPIPVLHTLDVSTSNAPVDVEAQASLVPLPQRLSGPPTGEEPQSLFGDEDNW